jgi:hypothetical protein
MMVAVLADGPNYEYYPQKLTTGPETIERRFSDSWGAKSIRSLLFLHAVSTILTLLWLPMNSIFSQLQILPIKQSPKL